MSADPGPGTGNQRRHEPIPATPAHGDDAAARTDEPAEAPAAPGSAGSPPVASPEAAVPSIAPPGLADGEVAPEAAPTTSF